MHVNEVGLRQQRIFVPYKSHQDALSFLGKVLEDERGVVLLQGPSRSGKSVLAKEFVRQVQSRLAVAAVDGSRMKTLELLSRVLEQFGYRVALGSVDEMLNMLQVFAVQQTRTYRAPLLILENINCMYPSALSAVCKLASLKVNGRNALRLVLVGNCNIEAVMKAPGMSEIAARVIGKFELDPMTSAEASRYLYAKLRSGGVERPDDIFSVEVCEKLHALSGGWPGALETMALSLLEQTDQAPVRAADIIDPDASVIDQTPKIIITRNGEQSREVRLTDKRTLIGRSDLNNIVVSDQFVSDQHALLIRDQNAVVVFDLKSHNGTFVNSKRVQSKVLMQNDIVSIGAHRFKMVYAEMHTSIEIEDPDLADTARMKTIADARDIQEQEIPTLTVAVNRKD
jgi:type II secretory pathway predicted ATPase ExeA